MRTQVGRPDTARTRPHIGDNAPYCVARRRARERERRDSVHRAGAHRAAVEHCRCSHWAVVWRPRRHLPASAVHRRAALPLRFPDLGCASRV